MDSEARSLSVLVAAGGTGGHLYPAIAVARAVMRRFPEARVSFVGTHRGLEGRIVPQAGFELEFIRAEPLRGGGIGRKLRGLAVLIVGLWDGFRVLRRFRPDVVLGVGAYVSGPLMLVASVSGYPTILLEPNATPGLANKWLTPFVNEAAIAWESTRSFFGDKSVLTGNPVRPEISELPPFAPSEGVSRILVFGGSQGSRSLNQAMVDALPALSRLSTRSDRKVALRITHQTGPADKEWIAEKYEDSALAESVVVDYIDDMAAAYASADIVVCRAGATTCAELSAAGRPSILIPLTAAGGHQDDNARMMEDAGASRRLPQPALDGQTLSEALSELLDSPETLESMARSARSLARTDAADRVTDRLVALSSVTIKKKERL